MSRLFMLAAALAFAGCASSGVKVTDAQAGQFVAGQSTEGDVIAKLGPPWTQRRDRDGTKIDMYIYSHSNIRAGSFIPYLGPLVGGQDATSDSVGFEFTPDGVLKDWNSATSTHEVSPISHD